MGDMDPKKQKDTGTSSWEGVSRRRPSPTFTSTSHESQQALGWLVGELDMLIPKFIQK